MPRFTSARARDLSCCDSAEAYQDELDRQQAEDERKAAQAEYWADQDEDERN